ncbi:unnamed protein product [Somion occarium]|uniref:Uncharacterized protein n=1 Tax=Somion occarium TaxID=3059160 RepID=A0ABP1CZ84_9APHY
MRMRVPTRREVEDMRAAVRHPRHPSGAIPEQLPFPLRMLLSGWRGEGCSDQLAWLSFFLDRTIHLTRPETRVACSQFPLLHFMFPESGWYNTAGGRLKLCLSGLNVRLTSW